VSSKIAEALNIAVIYVFVC